MSDAIARLYAAVEYVNKHHPLPRCPHGHALADGAGEKLLPSCGCGGEITEEFAAEYVPLALFGKDHWSTLAYIETRIVDHREFRIIGDPRMRTCRRCWRIQNSAKGRDRALVSVDGGHEYPTRLADGRQAAKHCDWDCMQDLIATGILATRGKPDIGKKVTITKHGFPIVAALRQHKARGGTFATFQPPEVTS